MAKHITTAQLDQAAAALRDAKDSGNEKKIASASDKLADLRMAFRSQEETAGRRGIVGGDAVKGN